MLDPKRPYFVRAVTSPGGKVTAYVVNDDIESVEREHYRADVMPGQTWEKALAAANTVRDHLNAQHLSREKI